MKAALEFFSSIPSSLPKTVILGEMKELGESSEDEHEKMVEFLKKQPYDKIYLVGPFFSKWIVENDTFRLFDNVEVLIETLKKEPVSNRYILLKGSHSVHLEKVVDSL
jgi:UDP-N-acetylmuramoyl-tripeptide--D-alanyl-D-alanine ligase